MAKNEAAAAAEAVGILAGLLSDCAPNTRTPRAVQAANVAKVAAEAARKVADATMTEQAE